MRVIGWALRAAKRSLLFGVVVAGCNLDLGTRCSGDCGPQVSTTVTIQGHVVSTAGGAVIPGAVVWLGRGGYFSFPMIYDSTTADAAGSYLLTRTVTHRSECGYWVGARATGYQSSDPAFDAKYIACTTATQNVDIPLKPRPSP